MTQRVRLEIERLESGAAIATITNDSPEKHNAFDDEMDARLFEILAELRDRPDVRVVIWRGEGKSFSSGRDVGSIGVHASLGFQMVGTLRSVGVKFGQWVDVVSMQRPLGRGDADVP